MILSKLKCRLSHLCLNMFLLWQMFWILSKPASFFYKKKNESGTNIALGCTFSSTWFCVSFLFFCLLEGKHFEEKKKKNLLALLFCSKSNVMERFSAYSKKKFFFSEIFRSRQKKKRENINMKTFFPDVGTNQEPNGLHQLM